MDWWIFQFCVQVLFYGAFFANYDSLSRDGIGGSVFLNIAFASIILPILSFKLKSGWLSEQTKTKSGKAWAWANLILGIAFMSAIMIQGSLEYSQELLKLKGSHPSLL